jgi:hypothetical protein
VRKTEDRLLEIDPGEGKLNGAAAAGALGTEQVESWLWDLGRSAAAGAQQRECDKGTALLTGVEHWG